MRVVLGVLRHPLTNLNHFFVGHAKEHPSYHLKVGHQVLAGSLLVSAKEEVIELISSELESVSN